MHAAPDKDKAVSSVIAAPDGSSTKTQRDTTNKRSRASPSKSVAKKLFTGGDKDDNAASDSGVDAADLNRSGASPSKSIAKKLFTGGDKDDNAASDSGVDAADLTSPSKNA